ncbi:MAG: hypothetical protein E5X13_05645, partial [Mesorhizobium sp.]
MNKTHFTQLWQWLSVASVLFLATSIISLQGGSEFLGRLFGEKEGSAADNNPAIGYFGAIVGSGLFLVASIALLIHARRYGNQWHSRIPVIWLEGLDTAAWEAKVFQICILLIFVACHLPALSAAWPKQSPATSASRTPRTSTRLQKRHCCGRPPPRKATKY